MVAVTLNGARWWSMEKTEVIKKLLQLRLSKKIIAAMKAAKKKKIAEAKSPRSGALIPS